MDANASLEDGAYPFFTCSKEELRIDNYAYDCECVLIAGNGDLNVKYYNGKFNAYQRTYIISLKDGTNKVLVKYIYNITVRRNFYHKVSCLFESSSGTLTGSSGLL